MSRPRKPRFGVLVPVKPARRAKSRLAPLGDAARQALVTAFAADTVRSALACPAVAEVMVVTDDHRLAADLADLGAHVLPDGTSDDLNASLVAAAAELHRRWPDLSLAALCADLPALRTEDLTAALERAADHPAAIVADTEGVGTTLVTASSLVHFSPRFGPGSREEHVLGGAHAIEGIEVATLRRDVDTPSDLAVALQLGVGERTESVAAGLRL
jgi:2-phospho-L-lactate/phosphoenolpyruvate guanylyltransferase